MKLCGGVSAAVKRFPELHAAYVMEANMKHRHAHYREVAKRDERIAKAKAKMKRRSA